MSISLLSYFFEYFYEYFFEQFDFEHFFEYFFEYFFELIFEAKGLMKPTLNEAFPQGDASKPIVRTRPPVNMQVLPPPDTDTGK